MKKLFRIICLSLAALALIALTACGNADSSSKTSNAKSEPTLTPTQQKAETEPVPVTGELSQGSCKVLFTMNDGQTFTVQCEPEYAPETVENFRSL